MQFSCYNCGLKFSDGPPPMEALSEGQAAFVGGVEEVDRSVLEGTAFEGLSPYNFCGFCILMIREFPSCIKHPNHEFLHGQGEERLHYCTCGYVYEGRPPYPHDGSKWWIWANRMRLMHVAQEQYPHGDFELAESLINEEV